MLSLAGSGLHAALQFLCIHSKMWQLYISFCALLQLITEGQKEEECLPDTFNNIWWCFEPSLVFVLTSCKMIRVQRTITTSYTIPPVQHPWSTLCLSSGPAVRDHLTSTISATFGFLEIANAQSKHDWEHFKARTAEITVRLFSLASYVKSDIPRRGGPS